MRSSVIIDRLIQQGHEVHIVVSGDAGEFLERRYPSLEVTRIWGLTLVLEDNEVNNWSTLTENVRTAMTGLPKNVQKFFEVGRKFDADIVLSDFEMWSWMFAKYHGIPLIAIADHFLMTRCSIDPRVVEGFEDEYRTAQIVTNARIPNADHYVVPSFVEADYTKQRTTLVPPLLRSRVMQTQPTDGEHLLAYQTPCSKFSLTPYLRKLDRKVYVYGAKKNIDRDIQEGNIVYRPFSETQFIRDLASCHAVTAFSGFKLITESLHFGKPFYAIPVQGQFEHICSARYVDELGYGRCDLKPSTPALESFLERVPEYKENLRDYDSTTNRYTFETIDQLLERHANKPARLYQPPPVERTAAE